MLIEVSEYESLVVSAQQSDGGEDEDTTLLFNPEDDIDT
jgi:hypothetical protein